MVMPAGSRRRVLVVDDEEHTRETIQRLLTGSGYECVTSGDAAGGAELLKRSRFDLAIVDLVMPGKSGIEFLEEIKASHPGMAVLMLSAFAPTDSIVEAMRIGADDYMTKPVRLAALRERVQSALQRRDAYYGPTLRQTEGPGLSEWTSTGIERLDRILGGGLPQRALVAIAGAPGTGKSILVLHILAEAVNRGHHASYLTTTHQPVTKIGDQYGNLSFLKPTQIPHLDKRKTSLAPATKRAKMFLAQEERSPTRCSYYEARLTGVPVRAGEELDRYDGAVRPDDVPGVDASSGFEVIGRAPRETAGERSGLDGQPDDHLADAAELGRRRVGVRP